MGKLRPLGGILHLVISFQLPNLVEEAVFRMIDPLLELLRPQGLHEFIRILIGSEIDDPAVEPCAADDLDIAKGCLYAGAVRIIGQQNVFDKAADQKGLLLGKGGSQ